MKYIHSLKEGLFTRNKLDMSRVEEIKSEIESEYGSVYLKKEGNNAASIEFETDIAKMKMEFYYEREGNRTLSAIFSKGRYRFHLSVNFDHDALDTVNIIHQMIRKKMHNENSLKEFFDTLKRNDVEDMFLEITDNIGNIKIEAYSDFGYKIVLEKEIFTGNVDKENNIWVSPNSEVKLFLDEIFSINERLRKGYNAKLEFQPTPFPRIAISPLVKYRRD